MALLLAWSLWCCSWQWGKNQTHTHIRERAYTHISISRWFLYIFFLLLLLWGFFSTRIFLNSLSPCVFFLAYSLCVSVYACVNVCELFSFLFSCIMMTTSMAITDSPIAFAFALDFFFCDTHLRCRRRFFSAESLYLSVHSVLLRVQNLKYMYNNVVDMLRWLWMLMVVLL